MPPHFLRRRRLLFLEKPGGVGGAGKGGGGGAGKGAAGRGAGRGVPQGKVAKPPEGGDTAANRFLVVQNLARERGFASVEAMREHDSELQLEARRKEELKQGDEAIARGDLKKAAEIFKKFRETDKLSEVYWRMGNYAEAISYAMQSPSVGAFSLQWMYWQHASRKAVLDYVARYPQVEKRLKEDIAKAGKNPAEFEKELGEFKARSHTLNAVRELSREGRFHDAAKEYERIGEWETAWGCYAKANMPAEAARVCLRNKLGKQAAIMFNKAGQPRGALLAEIHRMPDEATRTRHIALIIDAGVPPHLFKQEMNAFVARTAPKPAAPSVAPPKVARPQPRPAPQPAKPAVPRKPAVPPARSAAVEIPHGVPALRPPESAVERELAEFVKDDNPNMFASYLQRPETKHLAIRALVEASPKFVAKVGEIAGMEGTLGFEVAEEKTRLIEVGGEKFVIPELPEKSVAKAPPKHEAPKPPAVKPVPVVERPLEAIAKAIPPELGPAEVPQKKASAVQVVAPKVVFDLTRALAHGDARLFAHAFASAKSHTAAIEALRRSRAKPSKEFVAEVSGLLPGMSPERFNSMVNTEIAELERRILVRKAKGESEFSARMQKIVSRFREFRDVDAYVNAAIRNKSSGAIVSLLAYADRTRKPELYEQVLSAIASNLKAYPQITKPILEPVAKRMRLEPSHFTEMVNERVKILEVAEQARQREAAAQQAKIREKREAEAAEFAARMKARREAVAEAVEKERLADKEVAAKAQAERDARNAQREAFIGQLALVESAKAGTEMVVRTLRDHRHDLVAHAFTKSRGEQREYVVRALREMPRERDALIVAIAAEKEISKTNARLQLWTAERELAAREKAAAPRIAGKGRVAKATETAGTAARLAGGFAGGALKSAGAMAGTGLKSAGAGVAGLFQGFRGARAEKATAEIPPVEAAVAKPKALERKPLVVEAEAKPLAKPEVAAELAAEAAEKERELAEAEDAKRNGEWMRATDLFGKHGEFGRLAEMLLMPVSRRVVAEFLDKNFFTYPEAIDAVESELKSRKVKDPKEVVESALAEFRLEQKTDLLINTGKFTDAARMFAEAGKYAEAITYHERAGRYGLAVELAFSKLPERVGILWGNDAARPHIVEFIRGNPERIRQLKGVLKELEYTNPSEAVDRALAEYEIVVPRVAEHLEKEAVEKAAAEAVEPEVAAARKPPAEAAKPLAPAAEAAVARQPAPAVAEAAAAMPIAEVAAPEPAAKPPKKPYIKYEVKRTLTTFADLIKAGDANSARIFADAFEVKPIKDDFGVEIKKSPDLAKNSREMAVAALRQNEAAVTNFFVGNVAERLKTTPEKFMASMKGEIAEIVRREETERYGQLASETSKKLSAISPEGRLREISRILASGDYRLLARLDGIYRSQIIEAMDAAGKDAERHIGPYAEALASYMQEPIPTTGAKLITALSDLRKAKEAAKAEKAKAAEIPAAREEERLEEFFAGRPEGTGAEAEAPPAAAEAAVPEAEEKAAAEAKAPRAGKWRNFWKRLGRKRAPAGAAEKAAAEGAAAEAETEKHEAPEETEAEAAAEAGARTSAIRRMLAAWGSRPTKQAANLKLVTSQIELLKALGVPKKKWPKRAAEFDGDPVLINAADCAEQNLLVDAAELFSQNNRFDEIGKLAEKAKDPIIAANLFVMAKNSEAAARKYLDGGDPVAARECLPEPSPKNLVLWAETNKVLGNFSEAAQNYIDAGEKREAIKIRDKLEKMGDFKWAAVIDSLLGEDFHKAQMYAKDGNYEAAFNAFITIDKFGKRRSAGNRAKDVVKELVSKKRYDAAANLLAYWAKTPGVKSKAASKLYVQAASYKAKIAKPEDAARLYLNAGRIKEAANYYEMAAEYSPGMHEEAAKLLEQKGKHRAAAEQYEYEAIDTFSEEEILRAKLSLATLPDVERRAIEIRVADVSTSRKRLFEKAAVLYGKNKRAKTEAAECIAMAGNILKAFDLVKAKEARWRKLTFRLRKPKGEEAKRILVWERINSLPSKKARKPYRGVLEKQNVLRWAFARSLLGDEKFASENPRICEELRKRFGIAKPESINAAYTRAAEQAERSGNYAKAAMYCLQTGDRPMVDRAERLIAIVYKKSEARAARMWEYAYRMAKDLRLPAVSESAAIGWLQNAANAYVDGKYLDKAKSLLEEYLDVEGKRFKSAELKLSQRSQEIEEMPDGPAKAAAKQKLSQRSQEIEEMPDGPAKAAAQVELSLLSQDIEEMPDTADKVAAREELAEALDELSKEKHGVEISKKHFQAYVDHIAKEYGLAAIGYAGSGQIEKAEECIEEIERIGDYKRFEGMMKTADEQYKEITEAIAMANQKEAEKKANLSKFINKLRPRFAKFMLKQHRYKEAAAHYSYISDERGILKAAELAEGENHLQEAIECRTIAAKYYYARGEHKMFEDQHRAAGALAERLGLLRDAEAHYVEVRDEVGHANVLIEKADRKRIPIIELKYKLVESPEQAYTLQELQKAEGDLNSYESKIAQFEAEEAENPGTHTSMLERLRAQLEQAVQRKLDLQLQVETEAPERVRAIREFSNDDRIGFYRAAAGLLSEAGAAQRDSAKIAYSLRQAGALMKLDRKAGWEEFVHGAIGEYTKLAEINPKEAVEGAAMCLEILEDYDRAAGLRASLKEVKKARKIPDDFLAGQ